jgi:hypothetical protein
MVSLHDPKNVTCSEPSTIIRAKSPKTCLLKEKMGGKDKLAEKLNYAFKQAASPRSLGFSTGLRVL